MHTGKESNRLEDVDAGDVHDLDDVLANYGGPGTDAFTLHVIPLLHEQTAGLLASRAGVTKEYVKGIRNRRVHPSRKVRNSLTKALAAGLFGADSTSAGAKGLLLLAEESFRRAEGGSE